MLNSHVYHCQSFQQNKVCIKYLQCQLYTTSHMSLCKVKKCRLRFSRRGSYEEIGGGCTDQGNPDLEVSSLKTQELKYPFLETPEAKGK